MHETDKKFTLLSFIITNKNIQVTLYLLIHHAHYTDWNIFTIIHYTVVLGQYIPKYGTDIWYFEIPIPMSVFKIPKTTEHRQLNTENLFGICHWVTVVTGLGKNGPGKNGPGKNGPGKHGPEKTVWGLLD